MLNNFLKYIEVNQMVKKGDRVLMAVSGGIDSMVMADLFTRTHFDTGIAHCNFCLRGREADKDEELVRKFAEVHNIQFFSKRFDTKGYAAGNGISIQMAARELRYKWFEELMKQKGFNITAIAHNLNDNIETLLINLTRGTGITGLTGMKPVNKRFIRPLLFATRESIELYCRGNKVKYREDKSNAETKYTRNRIRHLVIPVLKEINPSIEATLNETAERLGSTNEIVACFIGKLKKDVITEIDNNTILNISLLRPYIDNKSILFELTRPYGITSTLLKDLRNIIDGRSGGQVFTDTHRIVRNRKELIISTRSDEGNESYVLNSTAELRKVPLIRSAQNVSIPVDFSIPSDPGTACLDLAKISFPLTIRTWRPGDSFYPLGMKQKKKLSDYFTDRKYSLPEKERACILESDGKIVWIIGERIDDRFKITRGTKKALIIKAERP